MKIIILAGGEGKRLWPLSTKSSPKQFVHFGDYESLLKKTVKRFAKKGLIKDVFIVTNQEYVSHIVEDLREMDPSFEDRILVEPYSKNTAPAIAWSIRSLLKVGSVTEQENLLTVPIDHVFSDEDTFITQVMRAEELLKGKDIMAFGVKCNKPETGYGYIKTGRAFSEGHYEVDTFIEKPELQLAKQCIEEGGWLWNIGIYLFSVKAYLEELKKGQKHLYDLFDCNAMYDEYLYRNLQPISIDDAIISHSKNVKVMELKNVVWMDIGSWRNLYEFLEQVGRKGALIGNIANETIFVGQKI